MSAFDTLDARVQRNVARFTIERFLQELGDQFGPPDQWQMAAANRAIAAYQCGEFNQAVRCIGEGEKPPHQRPLPPPVTMNDEKLSLRGLWRCLVYPSRDLPTAGDCRFNFMSPRTHDHSEQPNLASPDVA
jgi:hypothetical protein